MFDSLPARSDSSTPGQIILWWEARRIPYNIAVGIVGFASVTFLLILGPKVVQLGEPLFSPFLLFVGVLFYSIGANICYTGGWIAELLLRKLGARATDGFATAAFKTGLVFSCLITSLPIWFTLSLWISHLR